MKIFFGALIALTTVLFVLVFIGGTIVGPTWLWWIKDYQYFWSGMMAVLSAVITGIVLLANTAFKHWQAKRVAVEKMDKATKAVCLALISELDDNLQLFHNLMPNVHAYRAQVSYSEGNGISISYYKTDTYDRMVREVMDLPPNVAMSVMRTYGILKYHGEQMVAQHKLILDDWAGRVPTGNGKYITRPQFYEDAFRRVQSYCSYAITQLQQTIDQESHPIIVRDAVFARDEWISTKPFQLPDVVAGRTKEPE